MDAYPIFLKLTGKPCLVVGGGAAAARKAEGLIAAGGLVTFYALKFCAAARSLAESGAARLAARRLRAEDLAGVALIIAADEDDAVNQQAAALAETAGVLINVVDRPALCDFLSPAVVERGPVTVAISTGGAAPVLARMVRAWVEDAIPRGLGDLAALAGAWRDRIRDRLTDAKARRAFWEAAFTGAPAQRAYAGDLAAADQALADLAEATARTGAPPGSVWLVGAGPGDADLLTGQALRLLQTADVIIYDRLVSKDVLARARRDADLIAVGKTRGHHPIPQAAIDRLIVDHARKGKRVVRLKGGDVSIFGRAAEEIAACRDAGVAVAIVPGITAASAAAAALGAPLTRRGASTELTFLTLEGAAGPLSVDWAALARPDRSLALYMSRRRAGEAAAALIAQGLPVDTPAALAQDVGGRNQKLVRCTLDQLGEAAEPLADPTLILIGAAFAPIGDTAALQQAPATIRAA